MRTDIRKHITIVAALRIGFGALGLLIALTAFTLIVGGGLLFQDRNAVAITSVIGTVVAGFLSALSLPNVLAGAGLLRFKPWARIRTLILAAADLVNVPVGTLLGVYTVWVLLQDQAEELFT
jgi:hypothetical protein